MADSATKFLWPDLILNPFWYVSGKSPGEEMTTVPQIIYFYATIYFSNIRFSILVNPITQLIDIFLT